MVALVIRRPHHPHPLAAPRRVVTSDGAATPFTRQIPPIQVANVGEVDSTTVVILQGTSQSFKRGRRGRDVRNTMIATVAARRRCRPARRGGRGHGGGEWRRGRHSGRRGGRYRRRRLRRSMSRLTIVSSCLCSVLPPLPNPVVAVIGSASLLFVSNRWLDH